MKWFIMVWLFTAAIGSSYSIMRERNMRLTLLKEMAGSLHKLTYYMYRFKMPAEEAFRHVAEEQAGCLKEFFWEMQHMLQNKSADGIADLWQSKSQILEQQVKLPEGVRQIWENCFVHIPGEPEALNRSLTAKAEELENYRKELQQKYMGEQKLVLTLGAFASAFFCLILW